MNRNYLLINTEDFLAACEQHGVAARDPRLDELVDELEKVQQPPEQPQKEH